MLMAVANNVYGGKRILMNHHGGAAGAGRHGTCRRGIQNIVGWCNNGRVAWAFRLALTPPHAYGIACARMDIAARLFIASSCIIAVGCFEDRGRAKASAYSGTAKWRNGSGGIWPAK